MLYSEPGNLLQQAAPYAVEIIQYSDKLSAPRLAMSTCINCTTRRLQLTTLNIACVAGGIVGARENKILAAEPPEANGEAVFQSPTPHSPRCFAASLSAPPPKLYFACAYNTASYVGYTQ